ncbi:MAG: tigr00006: 16s rrna ((1402)-n(4))-methyltransferase [Verrucomicrobiales bacterium]|nr:tigr00006: 16s rrna ((1402)-n(4))-methyltransferase [Verrucomicrobiales bacterium]
MMVTAPVFHQWFRQVRQWLGHLRHWEVRIPAVDRTCFPMPMPAASGGASFSGFFPVCAGSIRVDSRSIPVETGGAQGTGARYHIPVLEEEVVAALEPQPGKLILDGTLGGGGHTLRLLEAGAQVVALDQDPEALAFARQRLKDAGMDENLVTVRLNFAFFPALLEEAGLGAVLDGILLDIGVSSHQVDCGERGFSFQKQGPLDMRMDPDAPLSAADAVNTWPEEELARLFYEYGEEPAGRRVAKMLAARRAERLFTTTEELAEAVVTVIPKRGPTHPATKIFQALRIAVNDELGVLRSALNAAHRWLKPGGRLAVISFHSLEDRIVKQHLRRHSEPEIDRPEWPAPRPNPECYYRLVSRRAIVATDGELARNPRSRSARLRVAERLP